MYAQDPQMMQAIMRILYQGSNLGGMGAMGSQGSFTADPSADINQQLQIGQPLQLDQQTSPTGMNPNFTSTMQNLMRNNPLAGAKPFTGGQALQPGSSGQTIQPSGQGFSSFMQPHSPRSIVEALRGPMNG